mgnify:CR=1 FL=1
MSLSEGTEEVDRSLALANMGGSTPTRGTGSQAGNATPVSSCDTVQTRAASSVLRSRE